jgi:transcriptional regulator with XRE-family HTH domain
MMSKMPAGRPSLYNAEYHPKTAEKLTLLGCTQREMAEIFGVAVETVEQWIKDHPEFSQAIARGKEPADAEVARSLYQRAIGYEAQAVKIFMPAGATEPVYAEYIEHYPPDTNAASLWLRNRRGRKRAPDEALAWSDRVETDVSGSLSLAMLVGQAHELLAAEKGKIIDHQLANEGSNDGLVDTASPEALEDKDDSPQ